MHKSQEATNSTFSILYRLNPAQRNNIDNFHAVLMIRRSEEVEGIGKYTV